MNEMFNLLTQAKWNYRLSPASSDFGGLSRKITSDFASDFGGKSDKITSDFASDL
jgi:hypothetical protein